MLLLNSFTFISFADNESTDVIIGNINIEENEEILTPSDFKIEERKESTFLSNNHYAIISIMILINIFLVFKGVKTFLILKGIITSKKTSKLNETNYIKSLFIVSTLLIILTLSTISMIIQ